MAAIKLNHSVCLIESLFFWAVSFYSLFSFVLVVAKVIALLKKWCEQKICGT